VGEVESDSLGSRECQGLTMLREGGRVQRWYQGKCSCKRDAKYKLTNTSHLSY
jgi:hypothetical protein